VAFANISSAGEVTVRTSTLGCLQLACRISEDSMTTPSHFYVTLFSNASRDIYEQNTHDDFTVKQAQPVELLWTSI